VLDRKDYFHIARGVSKLEFSEALKVSIELKL
jgi:hypothetical protein